MTSLKLSFFASLKLKIFLFSAMHLVTDGLCSYLIFSRLYVEHHTSAIAVFLIYNLLAFVAQVPLGILIDKYNSPKCFLQASVGCILLGYLLSDLAILAVILIGVGNALFHICGGKYIAVASGNDIGALGIFVSTGAVGLVLGQKFFAYSAVIISFFAVLIVGTVVLLCAESEKGKIQELQIGAAKNDLFIFLAVISVVVMRSFVGKIAYFTFETVDVTFLIISIATALGKALGGFCVKRFGVNITAIISMLSAAACLSIGNGSVYLYLLGICLFNFSMPITLYYANVLLRGQEGFAFGVLAAALIPGYFLGMMSYTDAARIRLVVWLCLASVPAILIAGRRVKNAVHIFNIDDHL